MKSVLPLRLCICWTLFVGTASFQSTMLPAVTTMRQPLPCRRRPLRRWSTSISTTTTTCQHATRRPDNDWERKINEASIRKASSTGVGGETAAGAVLGGLLLGPFGALFGASVGSSFGRQQALDRARQQEMERLGISPDLLESARDIGQTLQESMEGLQMTQDALATHQRYARRLEEDYKELYDKAKSAMQAGSEPAARDFLLRRSHVHDKLKAAYQACAEERQRLIRMEENVDQLERRANEVDALLRRSVGAKTLSRSVETGLALSNSDFAQDPLLQKFKDAGFE